jgi:hypothetical protein
MKKINQKLLDTFTKPVCEKCNEELFVSAKEPPLGLIPMMCINTKCSNKYRSVEIDHN